MSSLSTDPTKVIGYPVPEDYPNPARIAMRLEVYFCWRTSGIPGAINDLKKGALLA